jgi:phosphatidylglycerol:prolipoprotein diacylglycerol transferase
MFGRLANFINGELWGRVTNVSWAVIFPTEAGYPAGEKLPPQTILDLLHNGQLHPRHPSQLYEAAGEGLLLFAILWMLRHTRAGRRPGLISAAFLALYATIRIGCEFFRDPDGPLYFGWMSEGQLLSLFMYIGAAIVWFVAPRTGNFQSLEKPDA